MNESIRMGVEVCQARCISGGWTRDCSVKPLAGGGQGRQRSFAASRCLSQREDRGGGAVGEVDRLDAVVEGEAHRAEEAVVVAELADVVADDAGDQVVQVGADHAVQQVVGIAR